MRRRMRGWTGASGHSKQATRRLPSKPHAKQRATTEQQQEEQQEQQREDEWVGMAGWLLFVVGRGRARFRDRLCGDTCHIGRLAAMGAESRRRRAEVLTADATVVHLVNLLATRWRGSRARVIATEASGTDTCSAECLRIQHNATRTFLMSWSDRHSVNELSPILS